MAKDSRPKRIYRTVDIQIHGDRKFRNLTPPPPSGQTLFLDLIIGDHTTSLPGLICIGKAAYAEKLEWLPEPFAKAFAELEREGLAKASWNDRVIWVPNAIRFNEPDNPNVVKGWKLPWTKVPECDLKNQAYARYSEYLGGSERPFTEGFLEAFQEVCGNGSRKGYRNQEQEQEQEQESPQPPTGGTGIPSFAGPVTPPAAPRPGKTRGEQAIEIYREVSGNKDVPIISANWKPKHQGAALDMAQWAGGKSELSADALRAELHLLKADRFIAGSPVHIWAERLGTGKSKAGSSGAAPAPTADMYDSEATLG